MFVKKFEFLGIELTLLNFIIPLGIIILLVALLFANDKYFEKRRAAGKASGLLKGIIALSLIIVAIMALVISLPFGEGTESNIFTFLAIFISAGIGLGSTTVLGNMIAGYMNRSINRFGTGDLVKIGEFQGRVIRKSVFHVEIQLEDTDLISIPYLYIASNPVKITRKTDTVVSTTVSLGYDVPRKKIEECLLKAATDAGLKNPFVFIVSLGDFSVVYKIHGILEDSDKFFSTTSNLNGMVMDELHRNDIEIVSPTFMNQRPIDEKEFIPRVSQKVEELEKGPSPEELIFAEAFESEKVEKKKEYLKTIEEHQKSLQEKLVGLEDEVEKEKIKASIQTWEDRKQKLNESIEEYLNKDEEGK